MKPQLEVVTGKQKPKSRREWLDAILSDSDIFLHVTMGENSVPDCVWIEFWGSLAHIPSLKNSKNNYGGLVARTKAMLEAMDIKFAEGLKGVGLDRVSFGAVPIHIALAAYGNADEDNTMSTIKDWLEPKTKQVGRKVKRDRGWGIGLIDNDKNARGYPLRVKDLGLNLKHTRIVIRPWEKVREDAVKYYANLCLTGGPL